jgi:hypothetical protein
MFYKLMAYQTKVGRKDGPKGSILSFEMEPTYTTCKEALAKISLTLMGSATPQCAET